MDILDSLRQAPSAELYRLYLTIGKMLDDPRRILEVRQRLHLGMEVSYIGGDPLAPPSHGTGGGAAANPGGDSGQPEPSALVSTLRGGYP
jgi:hypothetical protein